MTASMPPSDCIPGTNLPMLEFFPVDALTIDAVAGWVADDKARPWLDLGGGRQAMSARELFLMLTAPRNHARLFREPGGDRPLGLVCLNDAVNQMGSAEVWGVRGSYAGGPRNVSVAAFLLMLATGFVDLDRQVIGSWVVDGNGLSLMMHHRLKLTETGRQRRRHLMNGVLHDRILFDITRDEFAQRFGAVPAESGRTLDSLRSKELIHA